MELTEKNTVADFVVKNIKTAHIFKKYGIDFCCGGGISLEKACSKKKLDLSQLIKELDAVDTVHENTLD
ncbi:MAG: iron-sulfur cluster repair di-iron protein, partial [Bacteroidetes bacterium]|nr:iron-sulfur cluster repair di-iron protein [Bacteroidota bacterium]